MSEAGDGRDQDDLVRLASKILDGEKVDWDAETERTPALADEIRDLRWIASIAQVRGSAPALPPEAPLAPGDAWGTLRIVERIGRGAAGDVYRAFDPALGREVALKIWREDAVYRTTGTEARHLRKVRHARVVQVLGAERHDGLAGMWTDFLEGRNLEEVLRERGPLGVEEACVVGAGVCEALEAVHASHMVHRDVKTSNVMCLADETVVLIDFGSAKELPGGVPAPTERIRGTPVSTAPELLKGETDVAPSADLYSLGVLLYRLVSGANPIEARHYGELLDRLEARQRVPLSERVPGCDPAYLAIVERAMAWAPADRPASAAEVREALLRIPG